MRTSLRLLGTFAVASATVPLLGVAPASADSAQAVVSNTNWYWSGKDGATATTPAGNGPFATPEQASGVPDGDLGVAYTNDVDKVAALDFGLASIPEGASISRFAVTMPLDASATNLSAADGPAIVACPSIEAFTPADGPSPLSKAPAQALNVCADGTYDATKKTYTFDLTTLAGDWAAGAPVYGVVVRPKQTATTAFNFAFLGRNAIKVDAEFTPLTATAPVAGPTAPAAPSGDTGSGFAPAPGGFGSGDSGSAPVGALAPVSPPLTASQPDSAPPATAPVVAGATTPAAAARPVPESLRPNAAFWLLLVGLGVLLLAVGLVLGDPVQPVVLDARRRRFADVVRDRVAARTAAAAPARPAAAAPRTRTA